MPTRSQASAESYRKESFVFESLEAALAYGAMGYRITLCLPGEKRPIGKAWHEKVWTEAEITEAFNKFGRLNVGLVHGSCSQIIDVEIDGPEGGELLLELFDRDLPATSTFKSGRGPHRLFRWDDRLEIVAKATARFGAQGGLEIKLGAGGKASHSLVPPSIADESLRLWMPGLNLEQCPPALLPEAVIQRIIEANTRSRSDTEATGTQKPKQSVCAVYAGSSEYAGSSVSGETLSAIFTATRPNGEGFRNRQIWNLARRLKALPELADANFATLKPIVKQWHAHALRFIKTKEFDVSWRDFCYAWDRVKHAYGQGPLSEAYAASLDAPLPPAADEYEMPEVKQLIGLCYQLQLGAGEKPFFLTCRDAGGLLGIDFHAANKWLSHLVQMKVLELVKKGKVGRASEYRYIAAGPGEATDVA
jgi:hypothetical protein